MPKKKVLFLCTYNSCRSQMAEGLLRHLADDRFEAFSAGTHATGVNRNAIKVMAEAGIDISSQRSKSLDEFTGQQFDYVITLCDSAKAACPVFAGSQMAHWDIPDPAEATGTKEAVLTKFRTIRDVLSSRIESYFAL